MSKMPEDLKCPLNNRMLVCPQLGYWTSFQLVDEFGDGIPYAGLDYEAIDTAGQTYRGRLDALGKGRVNNHSAGHIVLYFSMRYDGADKNYKYLQQRPHYKLPITELQVRAEKTRFINKDGRRTESNPAQSDDSFFCQVEVRDLVERAAHLPPKVDRHFSPSDAALRRLGRYSEVGVCLQLKKNTVMEVRPLRALRPMLSVDAQFCALNLYQFAILATLSYSPFGQKPDGVTVTSPTIAFPEQPSSGNWFGQALAGFDERWQADADQTKAYYPLYEDVPYSKRLEIVPFDPLHYPANDPALEQDQEHPAKVHFLDDRNDKQAGTDSQAFITHNDEMVLISVRGTSEGPDVFRDLDALQVPFEEGVGKVHRGFYEAAQKTHDFVLGYLDKFYTGQRLMICGHSLGGAITLLLSEMLRRNTQHSLDIVLYTYGAPRAGDSTFVNAAAGLVHHRMVNHNDPVPSVPGTWLNTKAPMYLSGLALTFANVPAGLSVFFGGISNVTGEPYDHHGKLWHFMPVAFEGNRKSAVLWQPGCDTITQHAACTMALRVVRGLPDRPTLLRQVFDHADHKMVASYIPHCWATLRRWQGALEAGSAVITEREFRWIDKALVNISLQLVSEEKYLSSRPDARVQANQTAMAILRKEAERVATTYDRLEPLYSQRVTGRDVYGRATEHAQSLAANLERWLRHPENRVAEQLATAPGPDPEETMYASTYERPAPPLDIDAMYPL